jgi:hypothetical protein
MNYQGTKQPVIEGIPTDAGTKGQKFKVFSIRSRRHALFITLDRMYFAYDICMGRYFQDSDYQK